ncbi:FAD-binding protein [Rhodocaloribacter litoris]|uniref:GMC oxidoreductase n=1 Tax=Rhodocaloribacter litoris TaxID=2558931 RepID=UPI0014230FB2|nr:GMC oxidoreductase [Rhodocaloribacter litoris]QXD15411.1 FAD-binding protein [Rhodocaloribacter litoris]
MKVDVLIVGTGPVGATFARLLSERRPRARILLLDLGPRLTATAGLHVKNIADATAREQAQVRSQGPYRHPYPAVSVPERAEAVRAGLRHPDFLARPGTHLVAETEEDLAATEMPAAALSSNVGGMAAHWTCACPRPGNGERIPFLAPEDYERTLTMAERLLHVRQDAFPETPEGAAILRVLGQALNDLLPPHRRVQRMPLACRLDAQGRRHWTGVDTILGEAARPGYEGPITIRSETLCRMLLVDRDRVRGAVVEDLRTGVQETIEARVVFVAADSFRTPQLLWASGIRPPALGRYLNEHPFIFTFVELRPDLVNPEDAPAYDPAARDDPTIGVFWVPFEAPSHPFHGQIMHMDVSPLQTRSERDPRHIVGLGWGPLKEMRAEDRIVFSDERTDHLGMPAMTVSYSLTEYDLEAIEAAREEQARVVAAFGRILEEGRQTLMPPGSSLHYCGTVRMGEVDDGTSVCDPSSRVWGLQNLFVGGNGVIPLPTASNPTLHSVALAVLACDHAAELL